MNVYGLKNCDTCQKARKWLATEGIEHTFVDVRECIPSAQTLKTWYGVLGEKLLNRRGTTWRQLSDADRMRAEKNLPALLHDYPALMKRPVLVADEGVHVGFDEKIWRQLLKQNG